MKRDHIRIGWKVTRAFTVFVATLWLLSTTVNGDIANPAFAMSIYLAGAIGVMAWGSMHPKDD